MSLPANIGRRLAPAETLSEGTEIIVLVRAPTRETRVNALNEILFIGGQTFLAGDTGGDEGADGQWQSFELLGDSTRGAQAIEIFAREAGATSVEVFLAPPFDIRDVPVVGPVLGSGGRILESAGRTGEAAVRSAEAVAGGFAGIAGMLPMLLIAGLIFLVVTGKFKVSL